MSHLYKGLHGVVVPVITPVDNKQKVDEEAFRAVIRMCIAAGADGIFAGGSAGMGPLLTESEWVRCMEIAYDEVNGDCTLLGGIITTSTLRALERIRILEQIGYDKIAVTPTFYITLKTDEEILSHFGACRESTSMEIIGYNIPSCTHSSISPKAMRSMCRRQWFTAIKESSGDRVYFGELLKIAKEYGINLLQGNEPDIAWGLSLGAQGMVPVCANFDPVTFTALYAAWQKGDVQRVSGLQERILEIREISQFSHGGNWIAGIMCAAARRGIGSGIPLLPIQPLDAKGQALIDTLRPLKSPAETAEPADLKL